MIEPDLLDLTGMSYDNTGGLGASTYRHVAFIEQTVPARESATVDLGMPAARSPLPTTAGRHRGPLADGIRRLQALHPRRLPRRLPDRAR